MRKLNLGCGMDYREGYINVDTDASQKADLHEDVTWLKSIPDQSCNEALAQDVLEHLPRAKATTALKEWNRVLEPGGKLILRLPSIVDLVGLIAKSESLGEHLRLLRCLYGTQGYSGDFHLNGFTTLTLKHELAEAGFGLTHLSLRDGWNFEALAVKEKHCAPDPLLRVSADEDFLKAIFSNFLRRPIDDGAMQHYRRVLQNGIARESVIETICNSAEYRALASR